MPRSIALALVLSSLLAAVGEPAEARGPGRMGAIRRERVPTRRRTRILRPRVGRTQIRRKTNILASQKFQKQKDASAVIRALASGNPEGFWKIGITPPKNFDSRMNEWAVVRGDDGSFRVVRGAKFSVLPRRGDLEIVEHSHPFDKPLSRPMTIEDAVSGSESNQITPSAYSGDLDVFLEWRQKEHVVHFPLVLREDGRIGNPETSSGDLVLNSDGTIPPAISMVVTGAKREIFREPTRKKRGVWVYELEGDYRAAGKTIWRGSYFIISGPDGEKSTFDKKEVEAIRAIGRDLAAKR